MEDEKREMLTLLHYPLRPSPHRFVSVMDSISHILKDMYMGNVVPIASVTFPEREFEKYYAFPTN